MHTRAWLCTHMVMCPHGYVQAYATFRLMFVCAVVMCPHGYVRGYARMCAWLCPMCGYVCPRVRVLTRSWLCVLTRVWLCPCVLMSTCAYVHWLCVSVCSHGHGYVCYVMLCYVMLCLLCTHPPAVTIVYTSINILSSLYLRQHKKIIYHVNYFFLLGLTIHIYTRVN